MRSVLKILSFCVLIAAGFGIGLYAGPKAVGAYRTLFPEPQYTTGDHRALLTKAGTPVVMYATSTCPYCAKARTLFAKQGVAYTEYQIDRSQEANAEFLAMRGIGVPLLYIGDRRIDGYREQVIVDALTAIRR